MEPSNDLKFLGNVLQTIPNNFLADSLTKSKIHNRHFSFEVGTLKIFIINKIDTQLITNRLINVDNFYQQNYVEMGFRKVCFKLQVNRFRIDQIAGNKTFFPSFIDLRGNVPWNFP